MAIKEIKIKNGIVHENATINFNKGYIASIVGLNGHGKSLLLETLKENSTRNINTNELTIVSYVFDISNDERDEILNLEIFDDLDINPLSYFDKSNYKNTAVNLDNAIVEKILDKAKQVSLADGSQFAEISYDEFQYEITNDHKDGWGSDYLLSCMSTYQILPIWYEMKSLQDGMQKIKNWCNKMESLIRTRFINPESQNYNVSSIKFKETGGIDYASIGQDFWFIRLCFLLDSKNELQKIKNGDQKESDSFQNFTTKMTNNFNAKINQVELEVKCELSNQNYDDSYTFSLKFLENKNPIDFESLSTGTKRYINILTQVGNVNENTILLIDEPDSGLHPSLQSILREQLEMLTHETKCRIILTTHSIYVLNNLNNRVNTYVSSKTKSGFILEKITDFHSNNHNYENNQIWDLLGYNKQKDLHIDKDDKLILVEGDTDVIYYKFFNTIKPIKNFDSYKIFPSHGDEKMPYDIQYLIDIKGVSSDNIFYILDGDASKKQILKNKLEGKNIKGIFIPFNTIEDIFQGIDKVKYTKSLEGKYINKLKMSMKFTYQKTITEATKSNIIKIIDKINAKI